MTSELKILPVPRQMIAPMWMHVAPFLLKGLRAATDMTLATMVDDLVEGVDTLWTVLDGKEVVAAFTTAVFTDEETGTRFLGVQALGGQNLERWAETLGETMAAHAKRLGVPAVRFTGREAWSRVLPTYRITGHRGSEATFERAVA
jgi:hypothetical protein